MKDDGAMISIKKEIYRKMVHLTSLLITFIAIIFEIHNREALLRVFRCYTSTTSVTSSLLLPLFRR